MKNKELAKRIKVLRSKNGYSQEELSEQTGLSLRTIQRIENGETEPRGDSLKKIAFVFNVSPDEIIDWTIQEDRDFILGLNLSALSFLLFPLLGILIPLIIWISKKDKIRNLNEIAKDILNFQITWTMILFVGWIAIIIDSASNFSENTIPQIITSMLVTTSFFICIMYLFNLIIVVLNSFRIINEKRLYYPKFRFIRR